MSSLCVLTFYLFKIKFISFWLANEVWVFLYKTNPISPDYHLDKIRLALKKPGGWSETDSKIKGNRQNSPVKDDVLMEICSLKPSDTIVNLKKIFETEDKVELNTLTLLGLDKISAYIALLFLTAAPEANIDLYQEEFYGELYAVPYKKQEDVEAYTA